MPTGYTADLYAGKEIDFRTFALRCARAMGACIMQRDDPFADPPKLTEVGSYYPERVAAAEARIAELSGIDLAEAARRCDAEFATQSEAWDKRNSDRAALRDRYAAMLTEARAWNPPTPEHVGLKGFMIEQLTQSLDFDCSVYGTPPIRTDPATWLADAREAAQRDLDRATKHLAEEEERARGRNAWITALYDGLGLEAPSHV